MGNSMAKEVLKSESQVKHDTGHTFAVLTAFDKEWSGSFEAIASPGNEQQSGEEKILKNGKDRREQYYSESKLQNTLLTYYLDARGVSSTCDDSEHKLRHVQSIGMMRMKYGKKHFVGTGSVFLTESADVKSFYVITAAHNVVDVDPVSNDNIYADMVWFERRALNPSASKKHVNPMLCRYPVTKTWVHPEYLKKASIYSGWDFAICRVSNVDGFRFHPLVLMQPTIYHEEVSLMGFPGEKHGELWGMNGAIPREALQAHEELLVHDSIDTTGGQTGAPLIRGGTSYGRIIAVHSGGNVARGKNYSAKITEKKLKWITTHVFGGKERIYEYKGGHFLSANKLWGDDLGYY